MRPMFPDLRAGAGSRLTRLLAAAWGAAALVVVTACDLFSGREARGGGGFEGETLTVAGQMLLPDGSPAAGARVRLRPREFQPGEGADVSWDTVSGPDGRFVFPDVPEGDYILESFNSAAGAVQVPVQVETPAPTDTLVTLPPEMLKPVGAVRGRVARAYGDSAALPAGVARIVGLDRSAPVGPDGSFLLPDLPIGKVDVEVTFADPPATRRVNGIPVTSGDTSDAGALSFARPGREDYTAWPHSRRIRLNTTPTGADIANDVLGYALLVRLNADNFDFGVAHPADGADLRVSKADGTPLPYEVEAWNPPLRMAALWVRLDTLYGNRSDQAIVLHWGRQDVFSFSDPRAVFRAEDGYAGVWHLGKTAGVDASGQSAVGRNLGTVPQPALAGQGRRFEGPDAVIIADSPVLRPMAFTLSCWIYRDGPQVMNAKMFHKGIRRAPFASYTLDLRRPAGGLTFKVAKEDGTDRLVTDPADLPDQSWAHAATTFDPATGVGNLYVNGRLVKSLTHLSPVRHFPEDYPLHIGSEAPPDSARQSFRGLLDEARLCRRARLPHRIKLDYESQRPDSKLLVFE